MSRISEFLERTHTEEEYIAFSSSLFIREKGNDMIELLAYAINKGFFKAPASTKYHGSHKGGLVKHSLAVVDQLEPIIGIWNLTGNVTWYKEAIIASFFHDFCKAELYKEKILWRKDENGRWESYIGYDINENTIPIGHGCESLRLIEHIYRFEHKAWAMAVNYHMGMPSDYIEKQQYSKAVERYPEILALHTADAYACLVMGV